MITEDQLNHRLRRYRNAAITGYVILFAGIAVSQIQVRVAGNASREHLAESGTLVAKQGCRRGNDIDAAVLGLLDDAKMLSKKIPQTPEQTKASKAFYADAKVRLASVDCTKVKVEK